MIRGTVMRPVSVSTASPSASTAATACAATMMRRLSTRSATTPAYRVNRSTGSDPAAVTIPSSMAESVSSSTSQPWAVDCIQVPTIDSRCPA